MTDLGANIRSNDNEFIDNFPRLYMTSGERVNFTRSANFSIGPRLRVDANFLNVERLQTDLQEALDGVHEYVDVFKNEIHDAHERFVSEYSLDSGGSADTVVRISKLLNLTKQAVSAMDIWVMKFQDKLMIIYEHIGKYSKARDQFTIIKSKVDAQPALDSVVAQHRRSQSYSRTLTAAQNRLITAETAIRTALFELASSISAFKRGYVPVGNSKKKKYLNLKNLIKVAEMVYGNVTPLHGLQEKIVERLNRTPVHIRYSANTVPDIRQDIARATNNNNIGGAPAASPVNVPQQPPPPPLRRPQPEPVLSKPQSTSSILPQPPPPPPPLSATQRRQPSLQPNTTTPLVSLQLRPSTTIASSTLPIPVTTPTTAPIRNNSNISVPITTPTPAKTSTFGELLGLTSNRFQNVHSQPTASNEIFLGRLNCADPSGTTLQLGSLPCDPKQATTSTACEQRRPQLQRLTLGTPKQLSLNRKPIDATGTVADASQTTIIQFNVPTNTNVPAHTVSNRPRLSANRRKPPNKNTPAIAPATIAPQADNQLTVTVPSVNALLPQITPTTNSVMEVDSVQISIPGPVTEPPTFDAPQALLPTNALDGSNVQCQAQQQTLMITNDRGQSSAVTSVVPMVCDAQVPGRSASETQPAIVTFTPEFLESVQSLNNVDASTLSHLRTYFRNLYREGVVSMDVDASDEIQDDRVLPLNFIGDNQQQQQQQLQSIAVTEIVSKLDAASKNLNSDETFVNLPQIATVEHLDSAISEFEYVSRTSDIPEVRKLKKPKVFYSKTVSDLLNYAREELDTKLKLAVKYGKFLVRNKQSRSRVIATRLTTKLQMMQTLANNRRRPGAVRKIPTGTGNGRQTVRRNVVRSRLQNAFTANSLERQRRHLEFIIPLNSLRAIIDKQTVDRTMDAEEFAFVKNIAKTLGEQFSKIRAQTLLQIESGTAAAPLPPAVSAIQQTLELPQPAAPLVPTITPPHPTPTTSASVPSSVKVLASNIPVDFSHSVITSVSLADHLTQIDSRIQMNVDLLDQHRKQLETSTVALNDIQDKTTLYENEVRIIDTVVIAAKNQMRDIKIATTENIVDWIQELDTNTAILNRSKDEIARKTTALRNEQLQLVNLENQLLESSNSRVDDIQQIDSLTTNNAELRRTIEELRREIEVKTNELSELELAKRAQDDLARYRLERINELKSKVENLESKHSTDIVAYSTANEALNRSIVQYKARAEELESDMQKQSDYDYIAQIEILSREKLKIIKDFESHKQQTRDTMLETVKKMDAEFDVLMQDSAETIAAMKRKLSEKEARLNQLSLELQNRNDENAKLTEEYREQYANYEQQISDLKTTIADLIDTRTSFQTNTQKFRESYTMETFNRACVQTLNENNKRTLDDRTDDSDDDVDDRRGDYDKTVRIKKPIRYSARRISNKIRRPDFEEIQEDYYEDEMQEISIIAPIEYNTTLAIENAPANTSTVAVLEQTPNEDSALVTVADSTIVTTDTYSNDFTVPKTDTLQFYTLTPSVLEQPIVVEPTTPSTKVSVLGRSPVLTERQLLDFFQEIVNARDVNAATEPVALTGMFETRGLYEAEKLNSPSPEIESPTQLLESIESFLSLKSALIRLSNYWMYTEYTSNLILAVVTKMARLSIVNNLPVDETELGYLRQIVSNTPDFAYEFFAKDIENKQLDNIRTLTIVLANIPKADTVTVSRFEKLYVKYREAIASSLY